MVKLQLTHLGKFLCPDTRAAIGPSIRHTYSTSPCRSRGGTRHHRGKQNVLPRGAHQRCHMAFEGHVSATDGWQGPALAHGVQEQGPVVGCNGSFAPGGKWRSLVEGCSLELPLQPGLAAPLPVNLLLGPKLSRKDTVFFCIWKISGLFSTLLQPEEIEILCIIVNICCPHLMPMVFPSWGTGFWKLMSLTTALPLLQYCKPWFNQGTWKTSAN